MRCASARGLLLLTAVAPLILAGCTSASRGTGSPGQTATPTSTTATTPPSTASTKPRSPAASSTLDTSPARPATWCVDGEITTAAAPNPEGGAAGHNSLILTFTNTSTRTCVLYGYPGADALDATGTVLAHAKRSLTGYIGGSYSGLNNITLHPGEIASTILEGDVGDGSASCTGGVSVVVTAPNLFHSTRLGAAVYSCDFTVHPVVFGKAGR